MVNADFRELSKYIDKTLLGHWGKILSEIYMSATDVDDDNNDNGMMIMKLTWNRWRRM